MPSSYYLNDEFTFFLDARIHKGEYNMKEMEDLLKGPIAKILNCMSSAIKAFQNDHMIVDLTKDAEEGTREAEAMFTEYFTYQNTELDGKEEINNDAPGEGY